VLAALALLVSGAEASGAAAPARSAHTSLLYVLNAGAAKVTPVPGHRDQLTITLTHVQRRALWYSGRSDGRSGNLDATALAAKWRAYGFAAHPPQAVLSYTDPRRGPGRALTVQLNAPTSVRGGLELRARILSPRTVAIPALAALLQRAGLTVPGTLKDLSLLLHALYFPVDVVKTGPLRINGCVIQARFACPGARIPNFTWGTDQFPINLSFGDFAHADLAGDTFAFAGLQETNLEGANLTDANLGGAQLDDANLTDANLTGATSTRAVIEPNGSTTVVNVPFSTLLSHAHLCHTISPTGAQLNRDCAAPVS
jgi:hypothetical protein